MANFLISRFFDTIEDRLKLGAGLVALGVMAIYLINNLLPQINFNTQSWESPYLFPYIQPIGDDFREGYFYPAKVLLQGKSPYVDYNLIYPPFSALFSTPFRLFKVETAYFVQVVLLYLLNIAAIFLALKAAQKAVSEAVGGDDLVSGWVVVALFAPFAWLAITSYGFLFSVERGNADIYPIFFALLALWVMIKQPGNIWLPVMLISIATHLKVYPAILFALLLWRYRWKGLAAIVGINLLLLLSTGPQNAILYVQVLTKYAQEPFLWVGNHSASSFGSLLSQQLFNENRPVIAIVLMLLPLLVWGVGIGVLWKRGYSAWNTLLWFVLSVPIMNLLPSVSHDYKLVILSAPAAILAFALLYSFARHGNWLALGGMAALMLVMFLISRTYASTPLTLANKYPLILLLQIFTLVIVLVLSPIQKHLALWDSP